MDGKPEKVRRGFLDVTIQVNAGYQLRLVGAHLKSKLPIREGEALVRRMEAELLRKHLDGILGAAPETNLICYGDFNDTRNEAGDPGNHGTEELSPAHVGSGGQG